MGSSAALCSCRGSFCKLFWRQLGKGQGRVDRAAACSKGGEKRPLDSDGKGPATKGEERGEKMSESGKEGGFVQKLVEGGKDAVAPTVVLRSPACCCLARCVSWTPSPRKVCPVDSLCSFSNHATRLGPSAEWSLWMFPRRRSWRLSGLAFFSRARAANDCPPSLCHAVVDHLRALFGSPSIDPSTAST